MMSWIDITLLTIATICTAIVAVVSAIDATSIVVGWGLFGAMVSMGILAIRS